MKTQIAETWKESFRKHHQFDDRAHGYIQFKGTDICMDCYCECGYHFHVDGYFANTVKCPKCGTVYAPNCFVEFIAVKNCEVEPLIDPQEIEEDSYWKDAAETPFS